MDYWYISASLGLNELMLTRGPSSSTHICVIWPVICVPSYFHYDTEPILAEDSHWSINSCIQFDIRSSITISFDALAIEWATHRINIQPQAEYITMNNDYFGKAFSPYDAILPVWKISRKKTQMIHSNTFPRWRNEYGSRFWFCLLGLLKSSL